MFLFLLLFLLPLTRMPGRTPTDRPISMTSAPRASRVSRLFSSVRLSKVIDCATFQRTIANCRGVRRGDGSVVALVSFSGPSARGHLCILSVGGGGLLCASIMSRNGGDKKGCTASFSGGGNSCGDSLNFCLARGACRKHGNCSLILGKLRGKVGSRTGRHTVIVRNTTCTGPGVATSTKHLKQDLKYPTLPRTLTGPVVSAVGGNDILFVCTGGGSCLTGDAFLSPQRARCLS